MTRISEQGRKLWKVVVPNLIAILALVVSYFTWTDNKSGLEAQDREYSIKLQQMQVELGLLPKDSVIFDRNSQIIVLNRNYNRLRLANDSLELLLDRTRHSDAGIRLSLYNRIDSLISLKTPRSDSSQVQILNREIAHLRMNLEELNGGNQMITYLAGMKTNYGEIQSLNFQMTMAKEELKRTQARLLIAESERCPNVVRSQPK